MNSNDQFLYAPSQQTIQKKLNDFSLLDRELRCTSIEKGIVLPLKRSVTRKWGLGGVLDSQYKFVEDSIHPGFASEHKPRFGGYYDFSIDELTYVNEDVIYCDPIYPQWGHFLVDSISRLWAIGHTNIKIVYCGFNSSANSISDNFLRFFELLGIKKEQLYDVRTPTQFRSIIIPELSYIPEVYYSKEFIDIFEKVKKTALENDRKATHKKIYLTRTRFKENSKSSREYGEENLENIFRTNGFNIVSPETLSLDELIVIISNADVIVSLSGTIAHNILFSNKNTIFIILNRCSHVQQQQYFINSIVKCNPINVDVFYEPFIKMGFPIDTGQGPFLLVITKNLIEMLEQLDMVVPKCNINYRFNIFLGIIWDAKKSLILFFIKKMILIRDYLKNIIVLN